MSVSLPGDPYVPDPEDDKDKENENNSDKFDESQPTPLQFDLPLSAPRPSSKKGRGLKQEPSGNPYFDVVSRLSPNELVARFVQTAPKRVQDAARTTVLGLLGSIPKYALETTILTTGEKLANLMFQLQMTGYMLKNAEYRLSLAESLKNVPATVPTGIKEGELAAAAAAAPTASPASLAAPAVSGHIQLHLANGEAIEVAASEYLAELRSEVRELEEELARKAKEAQPKRQDDLLNYIKSLPEAQMRSLTENINEEVLDAMKKLTHVVVEGLGGGSPAPMGQGDVITQQTGSAMAQLCMWQLSIGYNLRELEVREDIRKSVAESFKE